MSRRPYDVTGGLEDVEVITDPAEVERIRALWAEIQANPPEPDDVDALLAKVRGYSGR